MGFFATKSVFFQASLRSQKLPESTQIVVRVERILSGVQSDVYFKNTVDKKSLAKHQKVLLNAFNKLNECRTLIGWTTRPLKGHQNGELLPIYRHEGHLNDQDLKKFLGDHQKYVEHGL
uniref:54S ribosomal protein L51, mitochondrial n=1 Tax=Bursaphelenchus xylophilus TaxID=6326 RepID=A0A1I7SEQ2_BURXY